MKHTSSSPKICEGDPLDGVDSVKLCKCNGERPVAKPKEYQQVMGLDLDSLHLFGYSKCKSETILFRCLLSFVSIAVSK